VTGRTLAAGIAMVLALATWALWPSTPVTDEQQVRALVERAVDAANARDGAALGRALAADFHGTDGLSQGEVTLLMTRALGEQRQVVVATAKLEVSVRDSSHAGFVGTFVMFGRAGGDPTQGRTAFVDAAVEKRDGQWLVTQASWHD
jgi:hypothetical protein